MIESATIGIITPTIEEIHAIFVAIVALQKRYTKLTFKFYCSPLDKNQIVSACKKFKIKGVTDKEINLDNLPTFLVSPLNVKPEITLPTIYPEVSDNQLHPFAENTVQGWYEAIESFILYPELLKATHDLQTTTT